MKKITTLLLLMFAGIASTGSLAQLVVKMQNLKPYAITQQCYTAVTTVADSDITPKAYGIRVYDETLGSVQQFVSFDIDKPSEITVEKDLSQYFIRAAAQANGHYYMINSVDGICCYHLLDMDLESMAIDTIASYDILTYEANIIMLDMTYDAQSSTMYGIGYDLDKATVSEDGETVEVELALLKIDLATGEMTGVGSQGYCELVAIAADNDGYLWGLDVEGNLWDVSKRNGKPSEVYGYATDIPSSLQSMSFNPADNTLYWCGFTITQSHNASVGDGYFSKFVFGEDMINYEKIGQLAGNAEILGLYINPDPAHPQAPEAVSNFTVTPGEQGANSAILSWTNPSTLINGDALSGAFSVIIYRDNVILTILDDMTVGQAETYQDVNPSTGLHEYKIVCINSVGEGKTTTVKNVYIGRDLPGAVINLVAAKSNDDNVVTISWEQPISGAHGGWYDVNSLTYTIVRNPDNVVLAENTTATTITDSNFTMLQGYSYTITTQNIDGDGVAATTTIIVVGPALSVPYATNFATDAEIKTWSVIDNDNDGQTWFPAQYASTGQTFMKFAPDAKYDPDTEASDWLITPPIMFEAGKQYRIDYDMLLLGSLFPVDYDITIGKGATVESQSTVLQSVDSLVIDMAFTPQSLVFEVSEDGVYNLAFHIRNAVMVEITNVLIDELATVDVAVTNVTAPIVANINTETTFVVTLFNNGVDEVGFYTIDIVDANNNDALLATSDVTEALFSQVSSEVEVRWTPSYTGTVAPKAIVKVSGDVIADNDAMTGDVVTVLGEGEWAHIGESQALMNLAPIVPACKYSRTNTIYYSHEIGLNYGKVEGLIYYTYVFNNLDVKPFNLTLSLAATDLTELDGYDAVTGFTEVFNGVITPTPYTTAFYVPFDTPFNYTGGNLCVQAEHQSEGGDNYLIFYGSRDDEEIHRMWTYSSDELPFNNSNVLLSNEITNVSFFMTELDAVENIESSNVVRAYLSHDNLFVTGVYDTLNIYSVDGRLCATHTAGSRTISMNHYNKGVYIIEIIVNGQRMVTKVVMAE